MSGMPPRGDQISGLRPLDGVECSHGSASAQVPGEGPEEVPPPAGARQGCWRGAQGQGEHPQGRLQSRVEEGAAEHPPHRFHSINPSLEEGGEKGREGGPRQRRGAAARGQR